jgi:hypothetical protein
MHALLCWINQNAAGLTAIFTFLYLIATILIFNEARKTADAAVRGGSCGMAQEIPTASDVTN